MPQVMLGEVNEAAEKNSSTSDLDSENVSKEE